MPIELGVWRIGEKLESLSVTGLDNEKRLEDFLDADISIASPDWMVIGRQVPTDYGKFVDLLAIDTDGKLIVLELKKDRTPREIVAQLLDYGSWAREQEDADIVGIYAAYLAKYHPESSEDSLDRAFCKRFGLTAMPEVLNEEHELVMVASELDSSTERIVTYLADEYGVAINAIFFRVFKDGDREYLSRAWLVDPVMADEKVIKKRTRLEPWNGEYYVSFGHDEGRRWEDAKKYGYITAGGGRWYSRTLDLLEEGCRVWVCVPKTGYVAVGEVLSGPVRVADFKVTTDDGTEVPISEAELSNPGILKHKDDDEKTEYLVKVDWIKALDLGDAIWEKGFFANQNSVCKPRAKIWPHTVERLQKTFEIGD